MSSQSQVNVGTSGRLSSQDGVSQQEEDAPLSLPKLNRLFESSFVWDESSTGVQFPVIVEKSLGAGGVGNFR